MHADTDAIRALAAANFAHADELAALASKLAAAPIAETAFGPVGQRFIAVLTEAVAHEARRVAALRDRAWASGDAAHRTALAYDEADERAGSRVSGV